MINLSDWMKLLVWECKQVSAAGLYVHQLENFTQVIKLCQMLLREFSSTYFKIKFVSLTKIWTNSFALKYPHMADTTIQLLKMLMPSTLASSKRTEYCSVQLTTAIELIPSGNLNKPTKLLTFLQIYLKQSFCI